MTLNEQWSISNIMSMSILHNVFVSEHLNHEIRVLIPKNVKTTKTHKYKNKLERALPGGGEVNWTEFKDVQDCSRSERHTKTNTNVSREAGEQQRKEIANSKHRAPTRVKATAAMHVNATMRMQFQKQPTKKKRLRGKGDTNGTVEVDGKRTCAGGGH